MTQTASATSRSEVFVGIDTHADTHHAAIIDTDGRRLADAGFATSSDGYRRLEEFIISHGRPLRVGIEGTASYGAAISHRLAAAGHRIVEVNRPDRRTRRQHGKSDPVDAYTAADAVRTGRATTPPKLSHGPIEELRLVKLVRDSAVQNQTATMNRIRAVLRTAPADLADQFSGLTTTRLVQTLARLRPDTTTDPTAAATKKALQVLARRWQHDHADIAVADKDLDTITSQIAPELRALDSVGPQTAAQLLITAGSNPDRLHHETAFARLTGVAPIPASSGKTHRHRLHRGGDRQANHALWRIAFNRTRRHPPTQAYITRRREEHLTDKDIRRCLKRYLVREVLPPLKLAITRLQTS